MSAFAQVHTVSWEVGGGGCHKRLEAFQSIDLERRQKRRGESESRSILVCSLCSLVFCVSYEDESVEKRGDY